MVKHPHGNGRPGFDSFFQSGSFNSYTNDFKKNSTTVATLPGAWCCMVGVGTVWPDVSRLFLGGVESLISVFYLGVATDTTV